MRRGNRLSAYAALLTAGLSALSAVPALADQAAGTQSGAPVPTPTEKAVANLIDALVQKGALEKSQAEGLLQQFQADMSAARAATAAPAASPEVTKVPYVPLVVQDRIRDEVKTAVIAQAKEEHWATPNSFPDWLPHIRPIGDLRVREEGRYFGKDNYWAFVNVGAINAGSPYNVGTNNNVLPPIINSTHDRNFLRIRARAGFAVEPDSDWSGVLRIATGGDDSPVSTWQTLGGFYDKKSIWLDQAYIKYEPFKGDALIAGRMPNPFDATQLVWYQDINLDGVALTGAYPIGHSNTTLHAVLGAFPISYLPDDFPANALSDDKTTQNGNKWLFAGQLGASWQTDPVRLSLSAGYYDFQRLQGALSPACSNQAAYCLTDATRPGFMQKGNTLFALRNFTFPDPTNVSQPQYYGLASKFRVLDIVSRIDAHLHGKYHLVLVGDYARNLGYDANAIQQLPIVNNNESCSKPVAANQTCASAGGTSLYKSGDTGWYVRLLAGVPDPVERWDWNASFAYEYVQPDAVFDAFTDSDFHLGGTNAKGWIAGGNLALARNILFSARWLSSKVITGPTFSVDTLQVDLTARF